MRIAVAGATGNIGGLTVSALEDAGHDVTRISRSLGVDLTTGVGLDRALTGGEIADFIYWLQHSLVFIEPFNGYDSCSSIRGALDLKDIHQPARTCDSLSKTCS